MFVVLFADLIAAGGNGVLSSVIQSSNHQTIRISSPKITACKIMQRIVIVPFNHRIASYYDLNVGVLHCISAMCQQLYIYLSYSSTTSSFSTKRSCLRLSFGRMSATQADIKASGEIAVSPLINRVRGGSTISSDEAKEAFKGHEIDNRPRGTGHGIDPSSHNATFQTFGDDSYYTPIDNYEGRHRYDPKFEWEPHEERKLVRKVCKHSDNVRNTTAQC